MHKHQQAKEYFGKGFNCAQAVIGVYCQELGLSMDIAMTLSTGFGGGMRCGKACGAVTGALMVIGLKHGFGADVDIKAKEITNTLVVEFQKQFIQKNNSMVCKDILGYDLSKVDEMEIIKNKNLFNTVCPDMVESAVVILEGLL